MSRLSFSRMGEPLGDPHGMRQAFQLEPVKNDPVTAVVGGLGGLGAIGSIIGADRAADAKKDANRAEIALQREMYQQNRADQAPWRNVGMGALNQLAGVYGIPFSTDPNFDPTKAEAATAPNYSNFFASPDYQFRLGEGNKAIEQSAAARGLLGSGQTLKDMTRYSQGLASSEFGNWFNRLSGLAGTGQSATNQLGAYGQNYANQVGQNYQNIGNARASAYQSYGNAFNDLLSAGAYGLGRGGFGG